MSADHKQKVVALLKSFETGDTLPISYINPNKYIQHQRLLPDGRDALAALVKSLPSGTKANTLRVFQDGDFVFTHSEFDLFGPKVGFDIFRFEDGEIVEHWDNQQETASELSPSGHSMVDGPTIATDLHSTVANKALLRQYMDDLLAGRREAFSEYFEGTAYIQHNPWVGDGIPGLLKGLQELAAKGKAISYKAVHRILGEGNFVLVVSEATFGGELTAIYDLYRVENGKIAEHWDILQAIPPREDWKNDNGKF